MFQTNEPMAGSVWNFEYKFNDPFSCKDNVHAIPKKYCNINRNWQTEMLSAQWTDILRSDWGGLNAERKNRMKWRLLISNYLDKYHKSDKYIIFLSLSGA